MHQRPLQIQLQMQKRKERIHRLLIAIGVAFILAALGFQVMYRDYPHPSQEQTRRVDE